MAENTNNTPYDSFSSISSLYRELLVSKGIGKRGVEVIALEMLVFMFWSNFVKYSGLIGNIYLHCMSEVIGLWILFKILVGVIGTSAIHCQMANIIPGNNIMLTVSPPPLRMSVT